MLGKTRFMDYRKNNSHTCPGQKKMGLLLISLLSKKFYFYIWALFYFGKKSIFKIKLTIF